MSCVRKNRIPRNGFTLLKIPFVQSSPNVSTIGHIKAKFIRSRPEDTFESAVADRGRGRSAVTDRRYSKQTGGHRPPLQSGNHFSNREAMRPVQSDASCVSMTEMKNRKNPMPILMLATPLDFTVSTRMATTKTSSMDHLPRWETNL